MNILISNIIVIGILSYLSFSFLESKFNNVYKNIIFFGIAVFLSSIINYNGTSSKKALLLLIIYLLYVYLNFKGSIMNKLMVVIPFFVIILLSEIFIGLLMNYFCLVDNYTNINSLEYNLCLILSQIIAFGSSIIYVKLSRFFHINELPKYTWIMFVLPILTILLLTSITDYYDLMRQDHKIILIIIGLFLSNAIIVFMFFIIVNSSRLKKELEISEYKKETAILKYDLLNQYYSNNFNLFHTLLHDCILLKEYLTNQNYDKLDKKLDEVTEKTFKEFNAIYTNSSILNNIINNNLSEIMDNHISIKSVIKQNEFAKINFSTQIELFSLLLEIAINNCKIIKDRDRNIIIKSYKHGHQIIINETFSCEEYSDEICNDIRRKIMNIIDDPYINVSVMNISHHEMSIIIYYTET